LDGCVVPMCDEEALSSACAFVPSSPPLFFFGPSSILHAHSRPAAPCIYPPSPFPPTFSCSLACHRLRLSSLIPTTRARLRHHVETQPAADVYLPSCICGRDDDLEVGSGTVGGGDVRARSVRVGSASTARFLPCVRASTSVAHISIDLSGWMEGLPSRRRRSVRRRAGEGGGATDRLAGPLPRLWRGESHPSSLAIFLGGQGRGMRCRRWRRVRLWGSCRKSVVPVVPWRCL